MATTEALDKEVSPGERPQRPIVLPAGAPNTPIFPDVRDTPAQKQAIEAEQRAWTRR